MSAPLNFNLSEWALKNKGLILYFMLLLGIIGMYSYSKLSQSEDPPFTFKVMVVQTYWSIALPRMELLRKLARSTLLTPICRARS